MQPDDRLVCAFVTPLNRGDQFKDWPLHITIVPWFRADIASTDLATELHGNLSEFKPFQVVMDSETTFGRGKLVNLVAQPTPLMGIEEQVRAVVKRHSAWLVDETTKRRQEYRPHVTAQKTGRLYRGDTFIIGALYIIEQQGNQKEIAAKIDLTH